MDRTSKKHIVILAAAAALSFLTLSASAQPGASGNGNAPSNALPNAGQGDPQNGQARQPQRRNVFVYLNLTNEQKQEWQRIQRETTQNVRAARLDESLSEEQMQQKLREIHAEQRRQLLGLLSPEQQEALKQWWEEQKQQKADGNSGSATTAASSANNDDFFAGMVQDPAPGPAKSVQKKPGNPKN